MNIMRLNGMLRINSYYRYYCNGVRPQLLLDFPTTYNKSGDIECQWYEIWERNKYFAVKCDNEKDPLKMLLPPPNITGTLHLGHALTVTIQDILARWYRMKGHPVIWIPGFDHAGIATQLILERYLSKTKGVTKSDIGKEQFLSFIWEWKNEKEKTIKSQLKALGASLDWSKEYFTMSKDHNNAVVEAFVTLNNKNLLYRKKDLINWCPSLHSTISDIEVEHIYVKEKTQLQVPGYQETVTFGQIALIAYPVEDSNDEIIVATTRPETLFGDVAIAVHPDDQRYTKYIGKRVWHTLRETCIPIIADPLVDKNFRTGAVKITPAHDPLDYTIATNHGLDIIDVIDQNGNITEAGKQFKHLPKFIAREKVLHELCNKGLLRDVSDHEMSIPLCSRSHDVVDYLLKEQWFVKCKGMAEKASEAVKQGRLRLVPTEHEQTWYNYLDNIRDWCVSRQLWWGQSIPAYYVTVDDKTEWIVARTENEARLVVEKKYGPGVELNQDPDVLDTWFSSAILPFSVYGWPKETEDFKKYYPLTLMETGHDILFFWVGRMVMLGLELTDRLPFNEVLLHGILCDAYGKKMSKSVGNIISPEVIVKGASLEELAAQMNKNVDTGAMSKSELKRMLSANKKTFPKGVSACGADALRMTLCRHNVKKQKINFDLQECQTNRLFCNKIWQASRYVLSMTKDRVHQEPEMLTIVDRWILSRLSKMIDTVNNAFMQRDFHEAIASTKHFFYYEFCDFHLEATKWGFRGGNSDVVKSHTYSLRTCLEVFLRILAPIAPYLSEDLYKRLSDTFSEFLSLPSLLEAPYPLAEQFNEWRDPNLDEKINEVLAMVEAIRSITAKIKKSLNPAVHIVTNCPEDFQFYNETISLIQGGSKIFDISIFLENNYSESENSVSYSFGPDCMLFVVSEDSLSLELVKWNIDQKLVAKRSI